MAAFALAVLSWGAVGAPIYPMPQPPMKDSTAWLESNRVTIAAARRDFSGSMSAGGPSVIRPEYERKLGEMVFAVRREGNMQHPLGDFSGIFKALPSYARLHLFVPAVAVHRAEDELEDLDMLERTKIYPVESEFLSGRWKSWADRSIANSNIWMRDIALVGAQVGVTSLYLPLAYNATSDIQHNDSDFIRAIASPDNKLKVVSFPYFIRGGNLLVGEADGRLIAFVGRHEVEFNSAALPVLTGENPGEGSIAEEFLAAIKAVTGASKVVILPNTKLVFHLDQAMILLAPGRAGVLESVDGVEFGSEEKEMFKEMRRFLAENGFSITPIPSSPGHLSRYESSVNAVLFRNAESGRQTVILPTFTDAPVSWGGKAFESMMDLVADIYRQEGYEVISVTDVFHHRQGNAHCVTLPLE